MVSILCSDISPEPGTMKTMNEMLSADDVVEAGWQAVRDDGRVPVERSHAWFHRRWAADAAARSS
jgi:hypothetical protein